MGTNPDQWAERVAFAGSRRFARTQGFTLIELLVSTTIMVIVMLVLLQVIAGMTNIWHTSAGTISTFQSARAAFTTMTRTLSRATLKTYIDYVDANGAAISESTTESGTFAPISSFTRSSELTFIAGPTTQMVTGPTSNVNFTSGANGDVHLNFPGDCVFFQAPLGIINSSIGAAAPEKFLQRSLNTIGFYVSFNQVTNGGTLPPWLSTALNLGTATAQSLPRFRLYEYIEPTENVHVYNDTAGVTPITAANDYYPSIKYIPVNVKATNGTIQPTYQSVVLAENIVLLIIRPRLEPPDEQTLANAGGLINAATAGAVTYGPTTANSIISPNYNYDSRAWWGGAMGASPAFTMVAPYVSNRISLPVYARLMRNQLPPILDVAMVAVDPNTTVRFSPIAGPPITPNLAFQLPTVAYPVVAPYTTPIVPGAVPFTNSVNMDVDLANYGVQLASNHIRFRIFRSSVQLEGAAWVNSY